MKFAEKIYPDKTLLTLLLVFFVLSQTFVFIKNVVPLLVYYNPYALLKYEEKKGWKLFFHKNTRYFYDLNTNRIYPLPLLDYQAYKFKPATKGEYRVKLKETTYRFKPFKELLPSKFFRALLKNIKLFFFWIFGFLTLFILSRINYKVFKSKKFVYTSVAVSLILLVLVLVRKFVAPPPSGMPVRWLIGTSFQPSEFSKVVLILFLAYYIGVKGQIEEWKKFLFALFVIVVHALLVGAQTDLGMALFFIFLGFSLMFAGGVPWKMLTISFFTLGTVSAVLMLANMDTVEKRFSGWLDPFADPYNRGYQIIKSLEAVINGGFLGQGLGKGLYAALYIRESDTDYIASLIVENIGILGFLFILFLQLFFALRLFKYAVRVYGIYEKIIILGVALNFLYSVFVNYAMAFSIIPPKGIALPFLSYGVSNLISNMVMLGIVGSIYRRNLSVLNL